MHGLQQASSFFPTAKELSSGVQWFKDHPVLAAAAATAVSVITYLNALELPEGDIQNVENTVENVEIKSLKSLSASRRSLSRKSSGHASDGRLSAAVSWCDEHGGSLTQVFEDETPQLPARTRREDSESDSDDVAESILEPIEHHRALPTGLRKSVTTQHLQDVNGGSTTSEESDAAQTQSPQWGWYVPITPPQDQFIQSTTTGRESAVVLPCSKEAEEPSKMRRSVSGHIP